MFLFHPFKYFIPLITYINCLLSPWRITLSGRLFMPNKCSHYSTLNIIFIY
jgi:hypothetical protein